MWRRLLGRWRSLSIRWQMTALVTGLIAVTLSTFAVFLDVRFARETFTARAELLHRVADPMLAADLAETSAGADTDTVVLHRVAVDLANAFDDGSGRFARVADMDGVLVPFDPAETGSATAKSGPSAMDPTVLARAAARSTETIITRAEANQLAGDERFSYVVLLVPLASHGRSIGVAVLGDVVGPRDGLTSTIQITFLGVAVGAVVAALVARLLISAALRPLVQIAHATRRVASGDWEIRVSSRPSSAELDELAQAFDRMLEQLQGVFEAQRQFVADASHELRSPLTAIGGMLEMLQLQAERGDPTARERIESALIRETERLTRLVEDLLTLSQVERDGRPNELVQLDTVMTELRPMLDALTQGHELHLALGPSHRCSASDRGCNRWPLIWSRTRASTPLSEDAYRSRSAPRLDTWSSVSATRV